jgi:hypothetical protein
MKRVVILSEIDYAGSAFKLLSALKRHTDYDVTLIAGNHQNNFKHPSWIIIDNKNHKLIQEIINKADILHFKGDWPPKDGYLGLKIPDKPIVLTTSGSFFRKKEHNGRAMYCNADFKRVTLKTSFETDLLYPEYSDLWTPHPIDSDNNPILWKEMDIPIFMHIPSNTVTKSTKFVEEVFAILRKKIKCNTEIITGITFLESCEAKKRASIYFDQFLVGFYGNSALEAMQWGIPVVCWLSPWAITQSNGQLKDCPILNRSMANAEITATKAIALSNDVNLSIKTKQWCDSRHGYKAVAKQWDEIYKKLL